MTDTTTVVVIAHGSRAVEANDAHREATEALEHRLGTVTVVPAFLELAEPDIASAVDAAVVTGSTAVVVLPHFLYPGRHVATDIPAIIDQARTRHPAVTITLLAPSGAEPAVADLLVDQIERALAQPGTGSLRSRADRCASGRRDAAVPSHN
ncbi:MAG: sirohydrochlorin chelatase [Acidimicrobiales bacterium]